MPEPQQRVNVEPRGKFKDDVDETKAVVGHIETWSPTYSIWFSGIGVGDFGDPFEKNSAFHWRNG